MLSSLQQLLQNSYLRQSFHRKQRLFCYHYNEPYERIILCITVLFCHHKDSFVYLCGMISKNQLKGLLAYKQQKQRDAEEVYIVEGEKMCAEAIAWQQPIRCVAAVTAWLQSHRSLLDTVPSLTTDKIYELTDEDLERLSEQRSPNKVWMLIERTGNSRAWSAARCEGVILALDHLQDPGNLGTIMRTADWFGVRHILCSPDTVSCYNSKVVQASMGAIFRTHVQQTDLPTALAALAEKGHPILGAMLNGENLYNLSLHAAADSLPVLVIGNESRGISKEVAATLTHRLTIPNRGGTGESLNAGIATAILLSELLRNH